MGWLMEWPLDQTAWWHCRCYIHSDMRGITYIVKRIAHNRPCTIPSTHPPMLLADTFVNLPRSHDVHTFN